MNIPFSNIFNYLKKRAFLICFLLCGSVLFSFHKSNEPAAWIRINQPGYTPAETKVAVWCGKGNEQISSFRLVEAATGKTVYAAQSSKNFGAYGPFENTYRLNELINVLIQKGYQFQKVNELLQ
jgi:endoglucanase